MSIRKFHKVISLPQTLDVDAFYMVENGDYVESYLTDSTGIAKQIATTDRINALIDTKIATLSTTEIVADIISRDALGLAANTMVLVIDASGDSTVNSGAAMYVYDNTADTYTKVSEFESMDFSIEWADIVGKPTSSTSDIDDAVNKKHSHTNKTQLDKITENANNEMLYNGELVNAWNTTNW